MTGGIMSVDIRTRDSPVGKRFYFGRRLKRSKVIVLPYRAFDDYYEVSADYFSIAGINVPAKAVNVMIDSGTTFSHFPTEIITPILAAINSHCREHKDRCGQLSQIDVTTDTCFELKQPDENYKNIHELMQSFPNIEVKFTDSDRRYVMKPINYFYVETPENEKDIDPNMQRMCIALKGEEEGKIILGAFAMIDNYFYFDRKKKRIVVTPENCATDFRKLNLLHRRRNRKLLVKKLKRGRILEEVMPEEDK